MIALLLALALDVRPLTVHQVCATHWGTDHRNVTIAMKQQVFRAAGVPWANRGAYEVDHRVPRELAGADVVANLQLQRWPIARLKDADENRLHRAVCAGTLSLLDAQQQMRDWRQP